MSKAFFYSPEGETNVYTETNEFSIFIPENNNSEKIMVNEAIQTEPKFVEDESPEKDYKVLKEFEQENQNEFLNRKRK